VRIALVSDIHGNTVALDAVLADLAADAPDRVVCLGDVALGGPDPRGVIARLRGLGCSVVMGNTDAWLLAPRPPDGSHDEGPESGEIERWCADQLDDVERAYLATFAPTVSIAIGGGRSLLCYHGAPTSFRTWILPTTPERELDAHFAGWPAAVYAGGHTHEVMVRRHRQALVVNPGSVGLPVQTEQNGTVRHPAWAEYGLATVVGDGVRVELRRRPIDLPSLAASVRASGMPHAAWWIARWG
jgi:predicted phosphodiesterase